MTDIQSRITDDAAVLKYRVLEEEYVFTQKLEVVYLVTDTYFRRAGRWQLVATHVSVKPGERKPVAPDRENLRSLVGEYELSPGVTYAVVLEGDTLTGQRTGRSKEVLLPADVNTFFPRGSLRSEKVFVHDASGRTVEMLDRRENNDLVWKRVR
jgi:hypothetical protein